MNWLIAALGFLIVLDTGTKVITGKHITEHILEMWRGLRECVIDWMRQNKHLGIVGIVGYVTDVIDKGIRFGKRQLDIVLKCVAGDRYQQKHEISEATRILPMDEALALRPDLVQGYTMNPQLVETA